MARIELPFNDDRQFVMDLLEEQRHAQLSISWTERLHVLATTLCCFFTLWVFVADRGSYGTGLAAGFGLLCLVALALSANIRIVLMDFYRQFHYKEKFALFLIHLSVWVVPRLMFGIEDTAILLGIFLIFLCIQAIDSVFFARIYFVCAAAVLHVACFAEYSPPIWLVAAWYATFILAIRFGHIRFRLDRFGDGRGVYLREMLSRTVLPTVLPILVGGLAWYVGPMIFASRSIEFQPGMIERDGSDVNLSYSELIWDSFFIVVIVIALLLALNYLDKKLQRKRAGNKTEIDIANSTLRAHKVPTLSGDPLVVAENAGPREKILSAFRQFSDTLGRINLGRGDEESAEDYISRLSGHYSAFRVLGGRLLKPFNKACYGEESPSEEEAELFVSSLQQGMAVLRRELSRDANPRQ